MDSSSTNYEVNDNNRENVGGAPERKRVFQSPSLQSLKSFLVPRRSPATPDFLVISQPTLAEASREKMRNKIRQSPSMLSIHAKGAELASKYEKQQLDELLQHSSQRCFESDFCPSPDRFYEQFSLARTPAAEILQTLKIHARLASIESYAPILDIHMLSNHEDAAADNYTCVFEMPHLGQRLSDMSFESKQEPVDILLAVTGALAQAEETVQFEHRNLHPGNVMVDRDPGNGKIRNVTIINCALSRSSQYGGPTYFTPLEHPAFYEVQTPVLSMMRKLVKDPAAFAPITNVLWLTYLARYMYNVKPSSKLRSLYNILNPKWPLRRGLRSAREALSLMRTK